MMTNNDVLLFPASSEEHHTRRSSSYITGIRTRHWQYQPNQLDLSTSVFVKRGFTLRSKCMYPLSCMNFRPSSTCLRIFTASNSGRESPSIRPFKSPPRALRSHKKNYNQKKKNKLQLANSDVPQKGLGQAYLQTFHLHAGMIFGDFQSKPYSPV